MNKSKGMKAIPQFIGLLLCVLLVQSTFAAENQNQFSMNFIGNSTSENTSIENSTIVNLIDPSYYYASVGEGCSTEITVSFTNKGNETVFLSPKVVDTSNTNNIDESWINISPANATVAPSSVQYFTIEVNVPLDPPSGYYQGTIAFTDDIVPYTEGYTYPQYVNSMNFYLYVQAIPEIELQTNYIVDTLDAGTDNEYKIKIRNVAQRDLTINPTLSTSSNDYYTDFKQVFDNDAIEISAPSILKAGEIANMTLRVHVPENATGVYSRYIYMDVDGKGDEWSVPQLNLNFKVLQPPAPFVKTFYTTTDDPITIQVSGDTYRRDNWLSVLQKKDKLPFELELKCNSIPVNMTFINSSENGSADIEESYYYYPVWADENGRTYSNINDHYTATYKAHGAIGEWDLIILPKDATSFQYSINIQNRNQEEVWNVTNPNSATDNSSTENATDENTSSLTDEPEPEVPIADFSTNVTSGYVPLTVQFTDNSSLSELQSSIPPTLSDEEQSTMGGELANNILNNQQTNGDEYLYGTANVESIEVMPLESFPVQVQVIAEGCIPDGCTEIGEITTEREENTFNINISTKRPKDAICTQAIVPFSETIPLEVQGLKAGNYTVNVNGITGSFELAVDNTLDESVNDSLDPVLPGKQVVTEADSGTSINLKQGENFTLRLRENPTTGYSWKLDLSEGLSILNDEYTQDPAPEGMIGVPGTHSWIIEAVASGNQQVNGIYKRPWESTTGTEDTFTLNINSVSPDTISRTWDFGDGSTSAEQNPVHTFSTAGTYTVSLVASNENGTTSKTATITALEQILPPVANFESSVTKGYAPLSVQFIDLSENATEWKWDFGDGISSTEREPLHTYSKSGKYTVSLTVKNANGMDIEKRPKYISVSKRRLTY